jgi:hypothetical protein
MRRFKKTNQRQQAAREHHEVERDEHRVTCEQRLAPEAAHAREPVAEQLLRRRHDERDLHRCGTSLLRCPYRSTVSSRRAALRRREGVHVRGV